jgi:signal transduction histidine kinase
VPRGEMDTEWEKVSRSYDYYYLIATIGVLGLFLFVSWVFFYRIRQRLLRLQEAMDKPAEGGIPLPIAIEKKDEIGQLEAAFNRMIDQLETGRLREREEEELRRQLIANLSHDLRTPLTTIRGHAYSLKKEITSEKGQESLELIDDKISYLGQLIENLLSYTLLTSGKYPYNPEKTDIVRLVKTSAAAWYPVFENEGFELDIDLPDKSILWEIDGQWMNRILDNLFQNILRHAAQGKYAGVLLDVEKEILTIKDKGPGMTGESTGKGAGIGLSIAALMLKEMNLDLQINSSSGGTEMVIGGRWIWE